MADFIDDFHRSVNDWADHLGVDGEERDNFIEWAMEKAGYQQARTWTPPQPDEDAKGGGSMFSSRRKAAAPGAAKRQQQQRGNGGQGAPSGGPAGQYFRS